MIPLPSSSLDRGSAAPWIAALLAVVTAVLWLLPETAVSESRAALDQYALAHPIEMLPDSCADWLGRDHWTAIRVHSSSAQFDRLCMAAGDAESQAGLRRWGLSRAGSPLGWLSAPLLYPDLLSLVAGTWLLAAVVGGPLERRRGRRDGAIALGASAVLPALAWWALAGPAAQPWLGAAALVSALLAVVAVLFSDEPQRFWVPGLPEPLELPAWSLLGWWLALRLIAAALLGIERSALAAEVLALPLGALVGLGLRGQAVEALRQLLAQGRAQLDAAAAPPATAVGPSLGAPGVGPAVGTHGQAPSGASATSTADADDPPGALTYSIDERLDTAEDPALAALFADDPPPAAAAVALRSGAATAVPAQAAALFARGNAKADTAGPAAEGAGLDALLADLLGEAAPAAQPAGQRSDAPLARMGQSLAAPLAPAPSPLQSSPLQPSPLQPSPLQPGASPPAAARPSAVAPPSAGFSEATRAYAPQRTAPQAPAGAALQRPLPNVRVSQAVRRGAAGELQCEIDGDWLSLAADLVQAVAVGMIEHRDWPGAQPEIWIDVITDRGGAQRPAEVLRLHLSRPALAQLSPGLATPEAFVQLAEELASGGALCLPQQPLWPGPPWPRYASAAAFIAMWQRQLG